MTYSQEEIVVGGIALVICSTGLSLLVYRFILFLNKNPEDSLVKEKDSSTSTEEFSETDTIEQIGFLENELIDKSFKDFNNESQEKVPFVEAFVDNFQDTKINTDTIIDEDLIKKLAPNIVEGTIRLKDWIEKA